MLKNTKEGLNEKSKKINYDGLIYASVSNNDSYLGNVFIPRSIIYESQEFIVTSILKGSFKDSENIYSVSFSSDSELQTIESEAFAGSTIEYFIIPSSVTKKSNFNPIQKYK